MRRNWIGLGAVCVILFVVGGVWLIYSRPGKAPTPEHVVINEAARTLIYLPLYYALEKGYFREQGLDVQVVTGGTATNSMAAMFSGEANFAQADPMYVPISREKGARAKVVAQVVGRIGIWGVTNIPSITDMSSNAIRGRKISTHPRPMTAYTYTEKLIRDEGLNPDRDVEIIQVKPGSELIPLLDKKADFAVTVEPNVSTAQAQGARVVESFPKVFGDRVLTGLITTEDYIQKKRQVVVAVVTAYQKALRGIRADPEGSLGVAQKYFPQLSLSVLHSAIKRISDEGVIPDTVFISEASWNRAVSVRIDAGDLKKPASRMDNCDLSIMADASK